MRVAGVAERELVVATGTNHSQFTSSGNVSDHWIGRRDAREIIAVSDVPQSPHTPFGSAVFDGTAGPGRWCGTIRRSVLRCVNGGPAGTFNAVLRAAVCRGGNNTRVQ